MQDRFCDGLAFNQSNKAQRLDRLAAMLLATY
jgi:hypothetical protein